MTLWRLLLETLIHYRWTNLAVVLGAMVGSAILTGSFLVGDSMRGTLRDMTLERLGQTDLVHVGGKFFRQDLAERWQGAASLDTSRAAAVLLLRGAAVGPDKRRAGDVQIVGTTRAFWGMVNGPAGESEKEMEKEIIINQELARQIGVEPKGRLSLRLEKANDIPSEGLLGKREETIKPVPLTVDRVIKNQGAGRFSLAMNQRIPMTVFVPIERLAEAIGQPGRANALLVDLQGKGTPSSAQDRLANVLSLDDMGISLLPADPWVTIESRERILSPALASAIEQVIQEKGFRAQRILTYLANGIQLAGKVVPYSVVVGIDSLTKAPFGPLRTDPADILPGSGQAIVNRWTADRLGARVGSTIDLEYFAVRSDSSLEEKKAAFRVSAIAEMEGRAIDRSYTPEFPGITDADTFADWNAPFPVDLDRVQEEDEKYWKDYRTAPKVFVPLKDAQKLWGTRFGRLTSVRLASVDAQPLALDDLDRHLRSVLDPKKMGFWLEEIKARDLKASAGSTDFGTLFLSMSFFLIVSAAILVGLLFRLNTERRASSIGIMLATGSPVGLVRKALLAEGVVLAASGTVLGLAGSILYARWLIRLLSTWWRDAVGTSFVEYHASPMSFALGAGISMVVALLAIVWATRRLRDVPVPQLLTAGFTFAAPARSRWARWGGLLALGSLGSGLVLIGFGGLGWLTPVGAFFGGGTLVLMGLLAGWWARWTNPVLQDPAALVRGSGGLALGRLGVRNASRYPSRSLLTATLLALAVFLVVSVGTMRHGRPADRPDLRSGNGGFALMARSTHPLPRSLADPDGRFALNVSDQAEKILADSQTFALRVRPGDDASCLNVYQPKDPTILGVPSSLMARGGFAFASMLSPSEEERQNPWLMLERNEGADVVPVMGDAATLQWILKVPLGGEVATTTEDGREVRLRVVGTLSESVFQGQLLLSEENFKRLFPSLTGTRFFLIAPPAGQEDLLATKLEADLEDFGFDVDTTARVIQGYLAVQETYMAAFQTLGGLGLLLGTLGLGIVVLRNVLERRGELALLRAVGFSGPAIGGVVLAETATLLLGGMGIGTLSACLAVLPTLGQLREVEVLLPLGGMLLLILLVGLASSWFAVRAALANPIISSLRSER